jgi:hypothetical protein
MDSRDKPSVSFRATDGMSGKMDKSPNGPPPRGNNGVVDYSGAIMPKRSSYSTTPSSTGVGKGSGGPGGATRKRDMQRNGGKP